MSKTVLCLECNEYQAEENFYHTELGAIDDKECINCIEQREDAELLAHAFFQSEETANTYNVDDYYRQRGML